MIILDTNVLSEILLPVPDEQVLRWFSGLRQDDAFTTAICQAEMRSGAAILPEGRRKRQIEKAVNDVFAMEFPGRVLAFDEDCLLYTSPSPRD